MIGEFRGLSKLKTSINMTFHSAPEVINLLKGKQKTD
jgi:hypothetical protein